MESTEKDITYSCTKSYSTLNTLTSKTKNVWLVCHGIGYLSKSFIQYFSILDSEENYIIAPQAPSKYYLGFDYKKVGSCWLTKEDTKKETVNVLAYLDAVLEAENIPENVNLITLGYSQGVSVITRWLASKKQPCATMILYAGGIPVELKPTDYSFLHNSQTEIIAIYGNKDPFFNADRLKEQEAKIYELFGDLAEIYIFEGGHEFRSDLIKRWS